MVTKKLNGLFEQNKQTNSARCPECGSALVIRQGKHGPFQGCSTYPNCEYIHALSPSTDNYIVKYMKVPCPICHEELVLRQGRFGMFIGCSAYPSCDYIEKNQNEDEPGAFPACPECKKGKLQSRMSRFGKIFYACSAYPKCQFALNAKPVAGVCQHCGYSLLMEKKGADILVCANKKCAEKN